MSVPSASTANAIGAVTLAAHAGDLFSDSRSNDVVIASTGSNRVLLGTTNDAASALRVSPGNVVTCGALDVVNDGHINGRLGVGTTTPASELDVRGNEVRLQGHGDARYVAFTNHVTGAAEVACISAADESDASNTAVFGCSPAMHAYIAYNGRPRVTVDRHGYVGLGVASPSERLDVAGNSKVDGLSVCSNLEVRGESFAATTNVPSFKVTGNRSVTGKPVASFVTKEADAPRSAEKTVLTVLGGNGDGRVGVNVAVPQHALHVADGDIYTTGTYLMSSDARLKTDTRPVEDAVEKLRSIGGYTYLRRDVLTDKNEYRSDVRRAGVLAQEVRRVLPEAVRQNEDGFLSVAHGDLMALVVAAFRELEGRVRELESKTADVREKKD